MSIRSLAAAVALVVVCSTAYADWKVSLGGGAWPETWPKALEPLRKQSTSIQGGELNLGMHHIPFTKRDEFEAAWPQLLRVKTKGAPVILVRSPREHWYFGETKAGVLVHCPSPSRVEPEKPAVPLPNSDGVWEKWIDATFIELIVDGNIVDLNRIPLPADTPIVDERFPKVEEKDNRRKPQ